MTNPIIPPPELVQQWCSASKTGEMLFSTQDLATRAAQWGADQELEACCELTRDNDGYDAALALRAERRPKSSSLKEQALDELNGIAAVFRMSHGGDLVCDKIRRVLEQLDD
jgi:hypothetical protein